MTELKFDETTARALLRTAPRMKPRGLTRIYRPGTDFEFNDGTYTDTDALVLTPSGDVRIESSHTIAAYFEPVTKRKVKS